MAVMLIETTCERCGSAFFDEPEVIDLSARAQADDPALVSWWLILAIWPTALVASAVLWVSVYWYVAQPLWLRLTDFVERVIQ